MKPPRIPENEPARLDALESYRIMDTGPEAAFDNLTTLVARILKVPIALVSLVDAERQWFKSRYGLDAPQTPRDVSFCGHVVAEGELLVVPDAFEDDRFFDNPLVAGDPRVRFYAGFPLTTPEGHVLGTLCAIDHDARQVSDEDLDTLRILARQVVDQLELRRRALLTKDYEQLFENSNVLPAIADFRGFFRRISPRWTATLGHSEAELLSRSFLELVHEDDAERTRRAIVRLSASSGEAERFSNRFRCSDGSYRWLLWHATSDSENGRFYAVAHDDTQRKEAELRTQTALDNLAQSEERLRALFNTAVDAIVTIDDSGIIDRANAAVEQLFGYKPSEIIGRHLEILMPPHHRESFHRYLRDYPAESPSDSAPASQEAVALRKDGSTFPIDLSVSEMKLGGRRMFTGIVRDITERKRVERLKSEFISTVSHELRTPLTSIRGALGLLAGGRVGELSPQAGEMVKIALSNSERLVRLINDILDVEKISSGKIDLKIQELDLRTVIQQAIDANRGFAAEHHTEIVLIDFPGPVRIYADTDRLAQVFANLISNAAKFSPRGKPIELSVQVAAGKVRVAVRDWGPGVPEEFEDRLFERFAQADGSDARRTSGTGLGLSITKAITERMGGAIGYEPADGGGSLFYFELPMVVPPVSDVPKAYPRILICEDEPDIALLLKKILGYEGYGVDVAGNLTAARKLLNERDYDAVTLDLRLGNENGFDLLEDIRESAGSIPVVVVSAVADEARQRLNGGAVGIVDWLTKPIDEKRLLGAIEGSTQQPRGRRILHVEDDADLTAMVNALVGDLGTLVNARTLRAAREHLARESFDLILLDIGLPDGEGTELLRHVGSTPVIVFSAGEPDASVSASIVASLVKSRASERELRDAINSVLPAAS